MKKITKEQLKNIPMKEVIGYNTKMYDKYISKFPYGETYWKGFLDSKPMVKKFNEMYLSDEWDRELCSRAHHMTWNELFGENLT